MGFRDFTIPPALYPEVLGENYDLQVVEKIQQNPIGWANSLPMTEYAHVMLVITAHNSGGKPRQYIDLVWNRMLIPILSRYYMDLEKYRFCKAMRSRAYNSLTDEWKNIGPITMRDQLGTCTAKIRRAIRVVLSRWSKFVDKPYDNPDILRICEWCKKLSEDTELDGWLKELENRLETDENTGSEANENPQE
jgi:hypothetical protein